MIKITNFKILTKDLSKEIINKVNQLQYLAGKTIPEKRPEVYTDWNNGNKLISIKLPKEGDIIKRGRANQRKELKLKKIIAFSKKVEIWLCENTKTGKEDIYIKHYSPYN